jgi:hypothetical protein
MAFPKNRVVGGFGIGLAVGVAIGFWSGNIGRWIVFGSLMGILLAIVFSVRRTTGPK